MDFLLPLQGGKGGFGTLLRMGGKVAARVSNQDSMRDLSGRRIREVEAEEKVRCVLLAAPVSRAGLRHLGVSVPMRRSRFASLPRRKWKDEHQQRQAELLQEKERRKEERQREMERELDEVRRVACLHPHNGCGPGFPHSHAAELTSTLWCLQARELARKRAEEAIGDLPVKVTEVSGARWREQGVRCCPWRIPEIPRATPFLQGLRAAQVLDAEARVSGWCRRWVSRTCHVPGKVQPRGAAARNLCLLRTLAGEAQAHARAGEVGGQAPPHAARGAVRLIRRGRVGQ